MTRKRKSLHVQTVQDPKPELPPPNLDPTTNGYLVIDVRRKLTDGLNPLAK
jgi:hypothetical protein